MKGLLVGEDDVVARWAFETYKLFPFHINNALGIVDEDGKICGAILFHGFNGYNLEISYYGRNALTPAIVRAIGRVCSVEYNASRVTLVTSHVRKRFISKLMRIGFRLEGRQRCYYGVEDTKRNIGVRLVMFRDKINEIVRHTPNAVRAATGL
jgi:RimJ/RimL family protein N-acetyltransferase